MSAAETAVRAARARPRRARRRALGWPALVVGLFAGALILRLWGLKTGLPYVYNADENSHFVPRAIGMFGHSLNPDYFINPPAYTYVLHALFSVRWGTRSGDGRRRLRRRSDDRVRARARRLGVPRRARRRAARDRRRAAVRGQARRRARGRAAGGRVPAGALLALRAQRRADAGAAGAPRWSGSPASTAPAARASTCSPGSALGVAIATKYQAGIVLVTLVAAAFASPVVHARVRNLALALGLLFAGFFAANPYALLDYQAFREGAREADRDRGRGGRQARPREHVRLALLPRDVHLGLRLAAVAVRARRRGRAGGPAAPAGASCSRRRRCCCSSTSASRRASSRAGCCRSTRSCACWRPTAAVALVDRLRVRPALALGALSVLLLGAGAGLQRPQRPSCWRAPTRAGWRASG